MFARLLDCHQWADGPSLVTSPGPKPTVSPRQQAANQLAEAHGDVPAGFTGNVPIPPDPNAPDDRSFPQKVWDTAWGVGESAVDTTVDSVGTLGDAWRNFLVVPVHDAAVDPFGFNRGQRAQPSPEHSPAEIAAAAANIVSLIPIVGTGGRVGGAAVQEAVEAVLRRGGTAADAEAAGRRAAATAGEAGNRAPSDPTIPVGDRPASTPVGGRGDREINVKPGTNRPGIVNGREYTGHAFDRMQERGILPSLVEQAIREGLATPSRGNTTVIYDSINNLSVIINETGRVVTTSFGNLSGK